MIHPELREFAPPSRSPAEIERDDIVLQTIAEVEARMAAIAVNHTYRQAFKVVSRILQGMKPRINKTLNDSRGQIRSSSSPVPGA